MFTGIFGNSPRVKLLDFLANHVDYDYSVSQMAEYANIARPTVYKLIDELTAESVLAFTREMGNSNLYRLNLQNPTVISMLRMDFEKINKDLASGAFEERSAASKSVTHSARPARASPGIVGARSVYVARYAKKSAVAKKRR